jgi:hypothetical protein
MNNEALLGIPHPNSCYKRAICEPAEDRGNNRSEVNSGNISANSLHDFKTAKNLSQRADLADSIPRGNIESFMCKASVQPSYEHRSNYRISKTNSKVAPKIPPRSAWRSPMQAAVEPRIPILVVS